MGLEWSLANPKYRTLFELGKGSWTSVFRFFDKQCCNDKDFVKLLALEMKDELKFSDNISYRNLVANKIYEFMDGESFASISKRGYKPGDEGIFLVNDADDSEYDLKYSHGFIYVGSRYYLDDEMEYGDGIAACNRLHGVTNPRLTREGTYRYITPERDIRDFYKILVME